jgi:hypothetical protein
MAGNPWGLHCGHGDSNGGDLSRLDATRVAIICAGSPCDEDATRSVDQCVRGRGAGGHVRTPPNMVVHVAVLVSRMHGCRTCVSSVGRMAAASMVGQVKRVEGVCVR